MTVHTNEITNLLFKVCIVKIYLCKGALLLRLLVCLNY